MLPANLCAAVSYYLCVCRGPGFLKKYLQEQANHERHEHQEVAAQHSVGDLVLSTDPELGQMNSLACQVVDAGQPQQDQQVGQTIRPGEAQVAIEPWTWCEICEVSKHWYSHHCIVCQACVIRMDHHCRSLP